MRKYITLVIILFVWVNISYGQDIITIGTPNNEYNIHNVYGKVIDRRDRSTLPGVNIFIKSLGKGVSTDSDGNFMIKLRKGRYTLSVTFVGYKESTLVINVVGDGRLLIKLDEDLTELEEVIVTGREPDANVSSTDLGRTDLSVESIRELPPFLGEVDVLKTITLLPGVSTVGEASSGFNVRGGGSDQNLILLGGAVLYNPTHLFGLYSAFNSELVDNVTLYKGGIPAKFGGRTAAIVEIDYKDGGLTDWSGLVTAGTVSSKFSVNGPLVKDKLSLSLGGRVSYLNYLLNMVNDPDVASSEAFFFDGNALLTYRLNDKNKLSYSFYQSGDQFRLASDTAYVWQNQGQALNWTHSFNEHLSMELSLVRSKYDFAIRNESNINSFSIDSGILDDAANLDFEFSLNDKSELYFGVQTKLIRINPGVLVPGDDQSAINPKTLETEKALESAIYLQHDLQIGEKLALSYGLRYNYYNYLGPRSIAEYEQFLPLSDETIVSETPYQNNEVIMQNSGFEPRASLRWSLNGTTSLKLGYNRMYQYVQVISNTTTIAPTDIWKLSDPFIDPQIVDQYSIGLFKNYQDNSWETSIEAYYKDINNIVEYKDGADLILKENLETELLTGIGRAYGIELYIKKKYGRLTGWFSYTYSRSLRLVTGAYPITRVNNGDWYPSNYDKPHDGTAVMNYNINPLVSFSAIFTYSTGRAITIPSAKFNFDGSEIAYFDNRNQERAPDYHRLDLSLKFTFPAKKKIFQGEWVMAIYNVYGRRNAFSVFFDDIQGQPPQAFQLSVLGVPFPSFSYTVKF
jgi:TonB dependent receptor-like, beta-barrel/CarboxypepD_reg-like domain/TonB-dependent Receptor Plug Domain